MTRRDREEHVVKTKLYDEFSDYVAESMRDNDNPHLTLREYDSGTKATVTHLEVVLENVDSGTESLYAKTKRFREGAFLKTRESVKDGAQVFVAYIPFNDGSKKSSHGGGGGGVRSKQPSQNLLMLYVVGLFVTVIVALVKTTGNEWRMLGLPI